MGFGVMACWLVGACGTAAPLIPVARPGVAPPRDEAGLRKLLVGDVVNGGLATANTSCQAQFGAAGTIAPAAFDAFARCLAGLHLHPTGRTDAIDDTSVLTDDAGFELEATIVDGRLRFIGFAGRAPGVPDLPTITPQTLETLRVAGDPNATISAADAATLSTHPSPTRTEHLRLCVAETGELDVSPATTTTLASATAFTAVARTWKFRPFVVAGTPTPACAIVAFHYPAAPRDSAHDFLPRPRQRSKAGHLAYALDRRTLEARRVAGTKLIGPDEADRRHLDRKEVVGTFNLCLDETGHFEHGELVRSTGLPSYDAKIARGMMQWAFQPYVVDGVPTPVCSIIIVGYGER